MEFSTFGASLRKHVARICKDEKNLFVVELDKNELWNMYLDSFPPGTNEIFRERREFDCQCCRRFIKTFGDTVVIKDNKVTTIWDFKVDDAKYQTVIDALAKFVKSKPIANVFVSDSKSFGTLKSHEQSENTVVTWNHYHVKLPPDIKTYAKDTLGTIRGQLRDVRNVFTRSLEEITQDSVETVLELIAQKSLYKGEEWRTVLQTFLTLQKQYQKLSAAKKTIYTWKQSTEVGPVIGKIHNHSIGTLLINISAGMDLDSAVKKYEALVAPTNYKRPKAIFTKRMVNNAQKTIEELGLVESLGRRFASLDDITINNTLFVNRDTRDKLRGKSVFDDLVSESTAIVPKTFDKLEEIGIDTFLKDVVPTATDIQILLENQHMENMISLIAPENNGSPTLFKWDNGFSWAYRGNITDSMKEQVKHAGGKIDGVLRFSIRWNENGDNKDDLDAHCIEPNNNRISFMNKKQHASSGELDVDIINPGMKVAVENITWSNRNKMQKGVYKFHVNDYSHVGGKSGFSAEIEFDGQIHSFTYNKPLRRGENVSVAEVTMHADGSFTLKEKLSSSTSSKNIWGLPSNQFHPVSIAMCSPNYWDDQKGIGHKHFLFMLKDCKNDESPNGFFNEFLKEKFMEHKRVFEALGSKMRVADSENQLSGLGFSSTKHSTFICKVNGSFERTLKVRT